MSIHCLFTVYSMSISLERRRRGGEEERRKRGVCCHLLMPL
jgi:hypothetical protein